MPQTPEPPVETLSSSLVSAVSSLAYFLAISLNPGPTSLPSILWQPRQFFALNNAEHDEAVWGASELLHADKFSHREAEKKSKVMWCSMMI